MVHQHYQHIVEGAKTLHQIAGQIRILGHLAWPLSARQRFFEQKCSVLPEVSYAQFEPGEILAATEKIIRRPGDETTDKWLKKQARCIADCVRMLAATGSPVFYEYSQKLYGKPSDTLTDGLNTVLELANQFDEALHYFIKIKPQQQGSDRYDAATAAQKIELAVKEKFADRAPEIILEKDLSANATANSRRIRLRTDAKFSDRYISQLIQHEAFIHVATAINGNQQPHLPILGISHPGTTRTQEGLAVFAEFISGTMGLERLRRLADRVIAIQMAIDGADFIEVFRYFSERVSDPVQAYENTRRVFRGGVLTGGAPFTKDIVYLDGLIRVHNFLRAIVSMERVDVLPYLFCGKLDLEDIPAICELARHGLCLPPTYLPDWVEDNDFLLSYLAYSSFLNQIEMAQVEQHYSTLLQSSDPLPHLNSQSK